MLDSPITTPTPPADFTTRVVLLRHGKAETESATGRDEDRRLRPRGERQARWIGEQLAAEGTVTLILHSPLIRAAETATIVRQAVASPMRIEPRLATGHSARTIAALVGELRVAGTVVLVGHNPDLSGAGALLVPNLAQTRGELRTGEGWVLELAAEGWVIAGTRRLDEHD